MTAKKFTPISAKPIDEAQTSTALVEVAPAEVSLAEALHLDKRFVSSARRGSSPMSPHKIVWFTGNNKARTVSGKPLPDIAGWAIEQPDLDEVALAEDFELCDAMTVLCEQGVAAEVVVQHQDESGKPRYVKYWALSQASLFVVCEGIPAKAEMLRDPGCRWGIAYAWPQGRASSMHFSALIKELMDAEYFHAFTIHVTSYITDRLLACLKSHERVLNFADKLRERAGEVMPLPYYAYAVPVSVSQRTLTAGKEVGKTTEIYYPVPLIPRQLTEEYLESVAISEVQAVILEEDSRVEHAVAWSIEKSRRMLGGTDTAEESFAGYSGGVDIEGNEIVDIPESLR